MSINRNAKYKPQDIEDFSKPVRVYSDSELSSFQNKIQRFWETPRTLEDGQIAQKFNHEELHVAFGACVKVKHGTVEKDGVQVQNFVYLYNDRYREFTELWKQYVDYRRRLDRGAEQRDLQLDNVVAF